MMNFKHLFLTLFCAILIFTSHAQTDWTLSNAGISAGFNVSDFTVTDNNTIYAIGAKYDSNSQTNTPDIYKSENSGQSWSIVTPSGLSNHNYLYLDINKIGNTLFLSSMNISQSYAVYKSIDGGNSWFLSNNGIPSSFNINNFTTTENNTIYAIGKDFQTNTTAIYKSQDLGQSWHIINTTGLSNHNYSYLGIGSIGNNLFLSSMNTSPEYVVYKSIDGGNSWAPSNNGLESSFNTKGFTTVNNNTIYAIGSFSQTGIQSIYQTLNQGQSWNKINPTGLSNHDYLFLSINNIGNTLFLSSTDGNQNYAIYTSQHQIDIPEIYKINSFSIFPNPVHKQLQINHKNELEGVITIYNSFGMVVYNSVSTNIIHVQDLSKGIYFLEFTNNQGQYSVKSFIKN